MSKLTCDPLGRYMNLDTAHSTARFILETLEASGGTFDYSRFFSRGDVFLEEMGLSTFWMLDVAIAALEAAGVVTTETLPEAPLPDGTIFDYRITLTGKQAEPAFNVIDGLVWTETKMPNGLKYAD